MSRSEAEIVAALVGPGGAEVETIHTHASLVFLVGERVYKIKKAVDLGFLDYSTLARREAMCRAEVELNRRLAPDVYLGVAALTDEGGRLALDGRGPVVEWAVVMRRLPASACWSELLEQHVLELAHSQTVGRRLARFHREATRGPTITLHAEFAAVAAACRDNFTTLAQSPSGEPELVEQVRTATEHELVARRGSIEARVVAGVACEIHGDLRLEHVYDLGGRARPEDLRVVDCVEFSDALRCGDPATDIAFLAMDLRMHGGWALADALLESWLAATGDAGARELLPLFSAYRSTVRAKVRAIQAEDPALDAEARERLRAQVRGHLVLALGELALPEQRPCLVLVAGLPGTGKSRLAEDLAARAQLEWIRADAVRKELAGIDVHASGKSAIMDGIYTPAWNDRTYGECLARAERILARGGRAVVDASFKEEHRRVELIELARHIGARVCILCCRAPADEVRRRLAERGTDPSDADWSIYQHALRTWEPFGDATRRLLRTIDTDVPHADAVVHALDQLRAAGMLALDRVIAA